MVEITDEQLSVFQRATGVLQEMATTPATRRDFERLVKKIRPDVETSDDVAAELAKPYIEKLEATSARFEEYLSKQQERDTLAEQQSADRARDDAFNRLRAEGYTDTGMDAIKRLMIDRNIADPEAAAALFDRQNPKPSQEVAAWEPQNWNLREDAVEHDVSGLFANEDAWADKMVGTVLNEIRLGNRA